MSTVQSILTAALAKNRKNQPGIIATPAELLSTFRRIYPVFWTIGARVNPSFFGAYDELVVDDESADPTGWLRPVDAELVFLLEDAEGEEVLIVPLDERDADPFTPAVYEWGQTYYPAGNEGDPDPTTDELFAWYSSKPAEIVSADQELDALWPTGFDELLVLEVALVLALKDERAEEVAELRADRDVWLRRFVAHLEHATLPMTRSTGATQRFQGRTWIPLTELLTGGTEVKLG